MSSRRRETNKGALVVVIRRSAMDLPASVARQFVAAEQLTAADCAGG